MVSGYPTNVRGDVNAGGAGGGYYGGQYGVDLTTGQNGEGEGLSSQNVVGYGGGGGYGQVPPQGVLQGVSQGTPQGSLEGTHQRVPGYGGVGGYGQIPAQGVAQGGGYYGRDVYGQMGGYNGTEVNAGMNVGGGGEGQMGGDGAPVRPLQAQMESLSLGGRPMPTGYVQQSVPTPQMPGGGMMASGEPAVLPRPKFDSISVLARLNDLDAKSPMPVGSMQQSQQMDAYGRPIPGTVSQGPGRWPPTVACPPEMFYPPSPRCARMTTNAFPNSLSLAKKYGLPMGVVIQPMEDGDQLPVVNFGKAGVVRCRRCRSYVNYMCRFINDGRSWRCSLCQFVNDIPKEYWCGVDQHGHRHDVGKRPELICGSYEIVAPTSYMLRPPMGPTYMFVLEVTTAAVTSGLLSAAATGIRESLDLLPNDARTRVGLITFDSTLQFYRFKTDGSGEASMVVMPDVSDVFLPAPDQILVSLQEARSAFDQLLERLPSIHGSAAQPQPDGQISSPAANSAFGSAIIAAQSVLEGPGGRIVAIVSTRPKIGVGALKDRSDNTSLGTDRERVLLSPDNPFYKQKAVELQRFYISVDLIICPPAVGSFFDVATVAPLAKYTGGEIIYNPSFDIQRDGHLLVETLKRILGRETAWESVMRIRASKGVCCSTFHGRFFLKTTDLLALPNVDPDKTFAVEFKYDENVLEHQVFCIQIALLYTTSAGERRIRVHTTSVPIVTSLADLFLATDAQATTHLISRRAAETLRDKRLDDVSLWILSFPLSQATMLKICVLLVIYLLSSSDSQPFSPLFCFSLSLALYSFALLRQKRKFSVSSGF